MTTPLLTPPRPGSRTALRVAAGIVLAGILTAGGAGIASAAPVAPSGSSSGLGVNQKAGQPQPRLTVTPAVDLDPDAPSTVSLRGEHYATTSGSGGTVGGAYTLFGAITLKDPGDPGSWAPTKRGVSGTHYDYAGEAGLYQLMVNYPGNTTEPGMPYMDAAGNWTLPEHAIPGARFTSQAGHPIDCLAEGTQCGFMTIGAHGQRSGGVEVFTPVYFAGQTPDPGTDPGTEPGTDPGTEPGTDPGTEPGTDPGTGPGTGDPCLVTEVPAGAERTVTGTALSGTSAVLTVSPGRYLPCADASEIVISGTGYDPAKPIYVGVGALANHGAPEEWRRSAGGQSGPDADYDYGVPRLVVANGSADADVADAEIGADGTWRLTVTIPGKDITSFFGGTIDCATAYCGIFSFGAHGKVAAANEAYVPIFFGGQDAAGTPPTGPGTPGTSGPGTTPPVVPGTATPTTPSATGTPAPAANAQRAAGLGVNGGLAATGADDTARTALIGGVLLLSVGLFGGALLLRTRRGDGPSPI
ncbi:hypothetical protein [Leucobacter chromiireducens]|uniref:hypothetical protein n=1 Tax=Leucobacter chromiireducens TaxID=283877 RepID=UPI000F631F77|nr:hypothetical protein [Leucobacter chromiireducens]